MTEPMIRPLTRAENQRLLYAMLLGLVTDLARLRRQGHWRDHPDELRERARELAEAGRTNTRVFSVWLDWSHRSTDLLIETANCAEGWDIDRGYLIRAAVEKSMKRGRTDDWVKEMRDGLGTGEEQS